jgi:hypothetical protein
MFDFLSFLNFYVCEATLRESGNSRAEQLSYMQKRLTGRAPNEPFYEQKRKTPKDG